MLEKPTAYKKTATGNRKFMLQVKASWFLPSEWKGNQVEGTQGFQAKHTAEKKATDDSFLYYLVSFTLFKNMITYL